MPQNGQINIDDTIAAWADIVIKIWAEKIVEMAIWDTGALSKSLLQELTRNAGNSIDKIEFSFLLYGKFVDMGVGRELSKGKSGKLGYTPTRKPQPWFAKKFYGQIMKLRELLNMRYRDKVTQNIIDNLKAPYDKHFTATGERKR
jgi:hypothetical protein